MWPPPEALTRDFWSAFAAAGVYCGGALAFSRAASPRLMGGVLNKLSRAERTLWHSYVYCLLPGAISWCLAQNEIVSMILSEAMYDAELVLTSPPQTRSLQRAVGWELGFLAFDLGVMAFWRKDLVEAMTPSMFKQMLVHHSLALLVWPHSLMRRAGLVFVLYLVCTEVTSLFVNIRWLLLKAGCDDRPVYYLNGVLLVASFTLIRIVPIPWMLWALIAGSKAQYTAFEVVVAYLTVPIPALFNLYWFKTVMEGVHEALFAARAVSPSDATAKEALNGGAAQAKVAIKTDTVAPTGPKAGRKTSAAALPGRSKRCRTG